MVIGEEDGSDSQRRPGQRRQQRLAVAGWGRRRRGEEWAWSRLGTLGLDALGEVSV